MTTAKKTTAKKSVASKAPVKRTTSKKAASKTAGTKKSSAMATAKMRSFHVSPNIPSFSTFKITRQTVYWVIIVSFIIFMQLWILALQMETSTYIENQLSSINEGL